MAHESTNHGRVFPHSTLGDEIQGDLKWSNFVDGGDGFFYGIPFNARRVVKFNPLDKSFTEIGPDFGEGGYKWMRGCEITTAVSTVRLITPIENSRFI